MRPSQRSPRAAVLFALAISLAACSSPGGNEAIVPSEPPDLAPTPTLQAATPEGVAPTPEPTSTPPPTPTEAPDIPGLVWTEVDLADAFGSDGATIRLESVGDGRVLARGIDTILVTENSTEWTPVPVPARFIPWSVDITGERWLITGAGPSNGSPGTQILFSDDQGSNWTELAVDLGPLDGTTWVADAIVADRLIVVVVQSDIRQPDIDQALDDDMAYELSEERVHLFWSDGGPAEWVAEFPGWSSGGNGASDGFHLLISDSGEDYLLYSPDGRQWSSTIVDVEITDSADNEIWTTEPTGGQLRVEHFDGVYGSDQVLTVPDGISWVVDLAVGPAGVAAVGGPPLSYDEPEEEFILPDISFEKDGYELRYNQPEGGITLWDLEDDSAVYVFDAETLQREEPPEVVQEVEGDDGSVLVIFLDPETGVELVAFPSEELEEAFTEATIKQEETAAYLEYDPNQFLVGWSREGIDWEWQTLQEAFGLPESTPDNNSFTEVDVAVGHDFVIAKVQTHEFPPALFDGDAQIGVGDSQSDSTSAYLAAPASPSPPRWFIARVD